MKTTIVILSILFASVIWIKAEEIIATRKLPKILIIGDSISMGYTPFVRQALKEQAIVRHNKGNAQYTGTGLIKLDEWLGNTKWDIIYFNWGLWDLCYRHPESTVQGKRDKINGTICTPIDQYGIQLEQLVERLKQTGATLIWANTTLVPEEEAGRFVDDDLKYNAVAAEIMTRHNIPIDDLNTLTRSFPPDLFLKPGDVHYTETGYQQLAQQVTDTLKGTLAQQVETAQ